MVSRRERLATDETLLALAFDWLPGRDQVAFEGAQGAWLRVGRSRREALDLRCVRCGARAAAAVGRYAATLTALDVSGAAFVDDAWLAALPELPRLRSLAARRCERLTAASLPRLDAVPRAAHDGCWRLVDPHPRWSPETILKTQLLALRAFEAAGPPAIAHVFAHAAPKNKAATGPLRRFQRMMVMSYGVMLRASKATFREDADRAVYVPDFDDARDHRRFVVTFEDPCDAGGLGVAFDWHVVRCESDAGDLCWQTAAVVSARVPDGGASSRGAGDEVVYDAADDARCPPRLTAARAP